MLSTMILLCDAPPKWLNRQHRDAQNMLLWKVYCEICPVYTEHPEAPTLLMCIDLESVNMQHEGQAYAGKAEAGKVEAGKAEAAEAWSVQHGRQEPLLAWHQSSTAV